MGMEIDRMQGASTLQNWAEYIILLSKTNVQDLRLMKVAKSRGIAQSEEVYGIRWDSKTFTLKMAGIIDDYQKYLKCFWEMLFIKKRLNLTKVLMFIFIIIK